MDAILRNWVIISWSVTSIDFDAIKDDFVLDILW